MSSEIQVGYANPDLSKNPSLMEKSRFDRYFAAAPNGQTCGWTVSLNFGPTVGLAFGPTVKLNPKLNSKLNSKLNPNLDVDLLRHKSAQLRHTRIGHIDSKYVQHWERQMAKPVMTEHGLKYLW